MLSGGKEFASTPSLGEAQLQMQNYHMFQQQMLQLQMQQMWHQDYASRGVYSPNNSTPPLPGSTQSGGNVHPHAWQTTDGRGTGVGVGGGMMPIPSGTSKTSTDNNVNVNNKKTNSKRNSPASTNNKSDPSKSGSNNSSSVALTKSVSNILQNLPTKKERAASKPDRKNQQGRHINLCSVQGQDIP